MFDVDPRKYEFPALEKTIILYFKALILVQFVY